MTGEQKDILSVLSTVTDPEIPVLNVVEMGIVKEIIVNGPSVSVTIAPTYSGCPAMRMIETDIRNALADAGVENPIVTTVLSEPWSTDMMTKEGRRKLAEYGIAPPLATSHPDADLDGALNKPVTCPFCDGSDTIRKSFFGSTACKSMHYCNGCDQPFEAFKCI